MDRPSTDAETFPREGALRPRRGWYAYRVTGAASLPPWAVEVALAVERPVDLHPEGFPSQNDGMPGDPPGPRGLGSHTDGVLESRRVPENREHRSQAIVLLKAAGRANWLAGIVEAAAEVEAAAGVRRCHRRGPVGGAPAGGAVTPAHTVRRYLDWWPFLLPSRRRSWELPGRGVLPLHCGAGDRRPEAAQASWEARRGRCPDLRRSKRGVGPGGGRAPRRREDRRDRPTAGRCPGAPRLANEKHLGCGMWAGPWRRCRRLAWGARHNASPPALALRDGTRTSSTAWPPCTWPEPATTGGWRLRQTPGRLHPRRWRRCSKPASPPEVWAVRFQPPGSRGRWQ